MKARLLAHWRISTFRLALLFGVLFAIANVALLGSIYWQTSSYLGNRVDNSIFTMSSNFKNGDPVQVMTEMNDAMTYDLRRSSFFGLFEKSGKVILGNMKYLPQNLPVDGEIHEFVYDAHLFEEGNAGRGSVQVRAIIRRLTNGNILVVGRDFTQLAEIKSIIQDVLVVSGTVILGLGLLAGFVLSLVPMHRINVIRTTSRRIIDGEISLRMPVSKRQDELDELANIVNRMLDEIERLLIEVSSVTNTLAHDLRTPLTRLRLLLHKAQQQTREDDAQQQILDKALGETDTLLGRFRALLRISEIENSRRKAGFTKVALHDILGQVVELFEPLAEDRSVQLEIKIAAPAYVQADPDLLFEAISNLVDNAIKFTSAGGRVSVCLRQENNQARIDVIDTGCGIAEAEREAVFQRFYRGKQTEYHSGHGLGLSIVAAILRLHGFTLRLEDVGLGTHISIWCALQN